MYIMSLFIPPSLSLYNNSFSVLNRTLLTLLLASLALSMLKHAAMRTLATGERLAIGAKPALVSDRQTFAEGGSGLPAR